MSKMNVWLSWTVRRFWIVIMLITPLPIVYFVASNSRNQITNFKVLHVDVRGDNLSPKMISCFSRCGSQIYESTSEMLTTINYSITAPATVPSDETENSSIPTIYIVTPTYKRATQMADMIRVAYTLKLVPNIVWIVVEDASVPTTSITTLLKNINIPHKHMYLRSPWRAKTGKGFAHRLKALKWIKENVQKGGVLYFADDDNTYDLRVFEEMRYTKKVSVWPVGLIGAFGVSTPVVVNGTVVGFHDAFPGMRKFAMDMAGFAVNVDFLKSRHNVTFENKLGYLEDSFLRSLGIELSDLEPKANNCTMVFVWHTKTLMSVFPKYKNLQKVKNHKSTNVLELYRNIIKYS